VRELTYPTLPYPGRVEKNIVWNELRKGRPCVVDVREAELM
jgi:hypothetical protein